MEQSKWNYLLEKGEEDHTDEGDGEDDEDDSDVDSEDNASHQLTNNKHKKRK